MSAPPVAASSSVTDVIMNPIEDGFDKIGMMSGEFAPLLRAGTGLLIGYGIAYGLKPNFAFDAAGNPRPFGVGVGQTLLPPWLIMAAPAFIFGVLI